MHVDFDAAILKRADVFTSAFHPISMINDSSFFLC